MRYIFLVVLVPVVLAAGCSKSTKDLKNFDEQAWREDKSGCNKVRQGMVENLVAIKNELKGLDQDHLIGLLGKPDRQELYKRSQKFFYYQISPAPTCKEGKIDENIYLSIRFNATGLSKEIIVMNYMP